MTTNKKVPVPYAGRLARESVKFGLRVGGILGGVVGAAIWQGIKELPGTAVSRAIESTGEKGTEAGETPRYLYHDDSLLSPYDGPVLTTEDDFDDYHKGLV